jgi:hypothetical protein
MTRDSGRSISVRRFDDSREIRTAVAAFAPEVSEMLCLPSNVDAHSAGVWLWEANVVAEVDLDASVRSQVVLLRVVEEELLFESSAAEAVLGRAFDTLRLACRTTLELERA